MGQICRMILRRTGYRVVLAVMTVIWLATSALAYPIGDDAGSLSAATGSRHRHPLDSAALVGVDHSPEHLQASLLATDPHFVSPTWSASGMESPDLRFGPLQPAVDGSSDPAGFEQADPWFAVPPAMLGGKPRQQPAAAIPGRAQAAHTAAAAPADAIATVVNELQESMAETISTAFDANKDSQGRVTFSLAGIEGFHYSTQGGALTLGHADTSLAIVERDVRLSDQQQRAAIRSAPPASHDPETMREWIEFIKEVLGYPLFWVVIFFLVIGKIVLYFASRRRRKQRHRIRSESSRQAKVQRIRKRVRIRIKRSPSRVGIQEF